MWGLCLVFFLRFGRCCCGTLSSASSLSIHGAEIDLDLLWFVSSQKAHTAIVFCLSTRVSWHGAAILRIFAPLLLGQPASIGDSVAKLDQSAALFRPVCLIRQNQRDTPVNMIRLHLSYDAWIIATGPRFGRRISPSRPKRLRETEFFKAPNSGSASQRVPSPPDERPEIQQFREQQGKPNFACPLNAGKPPSWEPV